MDGNAAVLGWQLLVGLGCLSGLASGLLGIGGGMIVVPALVLLLPLIGIDGPELPKVAMATSLTLVIPTAIAGTQAHAARGSIDWRLWAVMAPALVAGSLLAMFIVRGISVSLITMIFVGFALLSALRLVRRKAPALLPLDAAGPNVPVLLAKSLCERAASMGLILRRQFHGATGRRRQPTSRTSPPRPAASSARQ